MVTNGNRIIRGLFSTDAVHPHRVRGHRILPYLIEIKESEMSKDLLSKLYWVFWCSTTMLTGILAGFMVSHSIMLARFFNWFIESGNVDLLHQTYTVFRKASSPQNLYNVPLLVALASGAIWAVLALILKRERIIAIIAGLATLWVAIIFKVSDLDEAEEAVLSGIADDRLTQLYVLINVPIHSCFAVIYVVSLFLLLLVALRKGN